MELDTALAQIADIRRQMSRTRMFHGYRAGTILLTGLGALGTGVWQGEAIPNAALHPFAAIRIWVTLAIGSILLVGLEIGRRYRRSGSSLERELTILAVEQFLPCVVAGGLVMVVLCDFAPSALWMLPGLWAIFFGLGMCASRRMLPGAIVYVGAFYLLCGLANLVQGPGGMMYFGWMMGLTFGVGQIATAVILHVEQTRES
jgi:hypothetical protein